MNKLVLFGCSHAYISKWGSGEVTTCCPTHKIMCSEKALNELADKNCRGSATPLRGETIDGGTYGYISGNYAVIRDTHDMCVTYHCD